MPRLTMFLPPDVLFKLDAYEVLYAMDPSEVVQVLARQQHVSTKPLSAQDVTWLVRHSKLRQFYANGLEVRAHAAA
jgi:hypothetical protein